ncbi:hypothetical protein, conserved, partial [Babesia bigemina]
MGFLYQVLKDVSEKQPYSVGKTTLISATKEIRKEIWNGHEAFKRCIQKVTGKVSAYNMSVMNCNDSLKNLIEKLIDYSKTDGSLMKGVKSIDADKVTGTSGNDAQVYQTEKLLLNCITYIKKFNSDIDTNKPQNKKIREALNDLNYKLRDKIDTARNVIKYETERLTKLSAKESDDLGTMKELISTKLENVKSCVNDNIDKDVKLLADRLKEAVKIILVLLEKIDTNLTKYVGELEACINSADSMINSAMEGMQKMERKEIGRSATNEIYTSTDVLTAWKDRLDAYWRDLLALTGQVDQTITELGEQFENQKDINNIFDKIKNEMVSIKGQGSTRATKGLQGVLNVLNTYSYQYGAGFEKTVEGWLNDIVGEEKGRKGWLQTYVNGYIANYLGGENTGKFTDKGSQENINKVIKDKIMDQLKTSGANIIDITGKKVQQEINDNVENKPKSTDNVEKYVEAIKLGCNNFAEQLESKIHENVGSIVGAVNSAVNNGVAITKTTNLSEAIYATLSFLSCKSRQVANELHSFALGNSIRGRQSIAQTLDTALSDAKKLHRQLETATGKSNTTENFAGKLDETIEAVRNRVEDITVHEIKAGISSMSSKIKKSLDAITEEFARSAADVNKLLQTLKSKTIGKSTDMKVVKGSLQEIKDNLHNLRTGDLGRAIKKAKEFVNGADDVRNKTIDGLKAHVGTNVTEAKEHLTKKARIDYVSFMGKLHETLTTNIVPKKDDLKLDTLSEAFQNFCSPLHAYLKDEIGRENDANHAKKHPSSQRPTNNYADAVTCVQNELEKLIHQIRAGNRYDHHVPRLLNGLTDAIDGLHPESFSEPNTPLLETIAHGLRGLVGELGKAYINRYDGGSEGMILVDARTTKVTDDGNKCAKVCLSLLSILYSEFKTILKYCVARCKSDQININTELGKYFATQGYKVTEDGKKHWELQDSKGMTGLFICKRMFGSDEHHLYYIDKSKQNALDTLHDCLQIYYQVCHVATFSAKKRPCNIFEMLCWMSGLPCNNVLTKCYMRLSVNCSSIPLTA